MLFVKSLINYARVNDHQAHPIEELDTRTVTGDGETQLTRLHFFPIAAELIFANVPRTCIELGWLAASQNGGAAIGIEPNPIRTVHCRVAVKECLSREHPRERVAERAWVLSRLDRRIGSDVWKLSRIEHKPEKSTELPEV